MAPTLLPPSVLGHATNRPPLMVQGPAVQAEGERPHQRKEGENGAVGGGGVAHL